MDKRTKEMLQSIDETLKRIEAILKKDKDVSPSQRIKECLSNLYQKQGQEYMPIVCKGNYEMNAIKKKGVVRKMENQKIKEQAENKIRLISEIDETIQEVCKK